MAELIWTEPALHDLEAIADYIALDDSEAARRLVQRVFSTSSSLRNSRRAVPARRKCGESRYRQIVEAPCRAFYRYDGARVFVLYVMRGEMRLRKSRLIALEPTADQRYARISVFMNATRNSRGGSSCFR